jgi:hypothetical protein
MNLFKEFIILITSIIFVPVLFVTFYYSSIEPTLSAFIIISILFYCYFNTSNELEYYKRQYKNRLKE